MTVAEFLAERGVFLPHECGGRGKCGRCAVTLNGERVLACVTTLPTKYDIELENQTKSGGICANSRFNGNLSDGTALIDVGTTTLAVCVCLSGVVSTKTADNPQRIFGADVVSRISASSTHLGEMSDAVRATTRSLLLDALCSFGATVKDLTNIVLVGNTAMAAIFAGVDCGCLGVAPYAVPGGLEKGLTLDAGAVWGFCNSPPILVPPCLAGFAGADAYADALTPENFDALLDLGTNGEILLKVGGVVYCGTAAAGPALEGGEISCGAAAVGGAVCGVTFDGDGFTVETIGGLPPVGLCGTGLICAVAALIEGGFVDKTGLLRDDMFESGVVICEGVTVTQADIRAFQLAKAAVRACFETLLITAGVGYSDIRRLYVAGGFAAHAALRAMAAVGLVPAELSGRTVAAGNAALTGAGLYASGARLETSRFRHVDMDGNGLFDGLFVDYMAFP